MGRFLLGSQPSKAPEGWRTPGRFAIFVADQTRTLPPWRESAAALRRSSTKPTKSDDWIEQEVAESFFNR